MNGSSWVAEGEVALTIGYADAGGAYHQAVYPLRFSRQLVSLPEATGWAITGVNIRGYQLHLADTGSDRPVLVDLALMASRRPGHEGPKEMVELLAGEIWDQFSLLVGGLRADGARRTSPVADISAVWADAEVTSCRGDGGDLKIYGVVHFRQELRSGIMETESEESIPFVRVLADCRGAEAVWEVYAGISRIQLGTGENEDGRDRVEIVLWGFGKRVVPMVPLLPPGDDSAATEPGDIRASVRRVEGEAIPGKALVHVVAEIDVMLPVPGGEVVHREYSSSGSWLLPIQGLRPDDQVEVTAQVKQLMAVRTSTGRVNGVRLLLRVGATATRRESRRVPGTGEVWLVDTLVGQASRDVVLTTDFHTGSGRGSNPCHRSNRCHGSNPSASLPVLAGRWKHEIRITWPLPEDARSDCAFRTDFEDLEVKGASGRAIVQGNALIHWRDTSSADGTAEKEVMLELDCPELMPHLPVSCFWEPRGLNVAQTEDGLAVIELRAGLTLVAYRNRAGTIPMIPRVGGAAPVFVEGGSTGHWAEEPVRLAGPVRSLDIALGFPESGLDGVFLLWKVSVVLTATGVTGRKEGGSITSQGYLRARGLPDRPVWEYIPSLRGLTFLPDGMALVSISSATRYYSLRGPDGTSRTVQSPRSGQCGWANGQANGRTGECTGNSTTGYTGECTIGFDQTLGLDLERPVNRISEVRAVWQSEGGGQIRADFVYVTSDNRLRHQRFCIPVRCPPGVQTGKPPKLVAYHAQTDRVRGPRSIRLTFRLEPITGQPFVRWPSQDSRGE